MVVCPGGIWARKLPVHRCPSFHVCRPGVFQGWAEGTVEPHSMGCAQPGITAGIPEGSGLPSLCWKRCRQVTGAPCRD